MSNTNVYSLVGSGSRSSNGGQVILSLPTTTSLLPDVEMNVAGLYEVSNAKQSASQSNNGPAVRGGGHEGSTACARVANVPVATRLATAATPSILFMKSSALSSAIRE